METNTIGEKIKITLPQTTSVGFLVPIGLAFCASYIIPIDNDNNLLTKAFSILFPYLGLLLLILFSLVLLLEIFSKMWPIVNVATDFVKRYTVLPIRKSLVYIVKIIIKGAVRDIILEREKYGDIEIIEAIYGTKEKNINVIGDIKNKIINGKLDMLVMNNEFTEDDPHKGALKKLKITYRYKGENISVECDEYKRITIP